MTHGTLAHNKMEIMSTLQELFKDQEVSSLAINLGLGISNRQGFYDCATTHKHKHTDAVVEIGIWLNWLKQKNVKQVVLLGHSRGGNQTAWFAAEHDESTISKVVLIAPQIWSLAQEEKDYKEKYKTDLKPLLNKAETLVKSGEANSLLKNTNFIYCKDTTVTADSFVSYYRKNPNMDTSYLMPKIKKPLLVFAGSDDTVVKNLGTIVTPLSEKHNFQFINMDGADHYFRDLYADELVETVIEFIGE